MSLPHSFTSAFTIPNPSAATLELGRALDLFNHGFPSNSASLDTSLEQTIRTSLAAAAAADLADESLPPANLDAVVKPMTDLDAECRLQIQSAYDRADYHLKFLMFSISGLLVGVALIAMIIGIAQYRSILWPLARMKLAVERIASGPLQRPGRYRGNPRIRRAGGELQPHGRQA